MGKKLVKIIVLTIILPIFALALCNFRQEREPFYSIKTHKEPSVHFMVIVPDIDDSFWQSVKQGVFEAAREFNVAVQFYGPRFIDVTEMCQYLDIAIASKVDGIVVNALDERIFTNEIDKAVHMNIPVVTIEKDADSSKRLCFVGTSSYKLGTKAGKLLADATGGKSVAAVILENYNNEQVNLMQDARVKGINDSIDRYNEISIKNILSSDIGTFAAGELTRNILKNSPEVNAIICTTAKDTLAAAHTVIELGKTGDISIIGASDDPEVLEYVEKGVVYGTVVSDPYNMGYESIRTLVKIKGSSNWPTFIDTGIHVVTAENIDEYRRLLMDRKGRNIAQ
jgi:ribose transport system substrate-binding protein